MCKIKVKNYQERCKGKRAKWANDAVSPAWMPCAERKGERGKGREGEEMLDLPFSLSPFSPLLNPFCLFTNGAADKIDDGGAGGFVVAAEGQEDARVRLAGHHDDLVGHARPV